MATIERFVNTGSTPGGDGTTNATTGANRAYASLSEWEAAEQTNLVTDGNSHVVTCGGGVDSTDLAIIGWTTGASNTITVRCTDDKHDGRSRDVSGTGYQLSSASVTATLRCAEDYITIDGLNIVNTTNKPAISTNIGASYTASDNLVHIKNCILHNNVTTADVTYVVPASIANLNFKIENCIVYGATRGIDDRNCASSIINNCTFFCFTDQIIVICDSTSTVKNSYAGKSSGSAECFFTGSTPPSGSNNASSDSTATIDYTSSITSIVATDQFVSIIGGSEDFTLKSGSDLEAAGVTVSGLSTDIIGTTRDVSTPDIGAFEFIPAPPTGGSVPIFYHHLRQMMGQ